MPSKVRIGRVIKSKMQKTVVVAVDRMEHHPLYRKALRRITTLYAHDPRGECQPGDVVRLVEVRPLSKTKRWMVKGVVAKASQATVGTEVGAVEEEQPQATPQPAPASQEDPA